MCLRLLRKIKIFLLIIWVQTASTLRLKSGKDSIQDKDHKASRRFHVNDYQNSSLASKRATYRINMPAKVAKLILPQMTNKNQETIIRIYPDKSAQNQSTANYMLSLSYKKLNDDDISNKLKIGRRACYYGQRPGCCSVCCPGSMCNPSMLPGSCICCPRPICPQPPCCCCCCCSSPPAPPPPPPPPKKPPPPPCPMVCLPCNPCPRPPPCRPLCIPRPIIRPCHPPCRIPAPPVTGPIDGPCIAAPPVMGPCHPPCMPQKPFLPGPLHPAPPIPAGRPVVVDHPLKGPPIFIDQCRDVLPECKAFAKSGMCNHPTPFHSIQQIRKICAFSCGICNDYDENAALLRRHTSSPIHVRPAVRAKLNRALAQIIRNQDLEGQSTLRPEQDQAGSNKLGEETGEKRSHDGAI